MAGAAGWRRNPVKIVWAGNSRTLPPDRAYTPKILNKRVFVHIGEFHSGQKRASGGAGGMRETGAATEVPSVGSPAKIALHVLFEV
jgi:hypothetical protein